MNPWSLIVAEIRNYRVGFIVGAVLIGLAVAMGIALTAQERAVRAGSARAAERFDLLVGVPGSETQLVLTTVYLQPAALNLLDAKVFDQLRADPGVEYAAPLAFGDYQRGYPRGYPIVGTSAAFVTDNGRIRPVEGRLFASAIEAVIGADVALAMGERFLAMHGTPQENIIETHVHTALQLQVVGRLARTGTPWDRAIMLPIEGIWAMHAPDPDEALPKTLGPPWGALAHGIPAIVVKPRSVADAYRLRRAWRGAQTTALFPAEVLVSLYRTLGDATRVMSLLLQIAQGLVFVAVLLAIFAVLSGRRATIAVLRAMGAPPGFVFAAIWGQVALMSLAGMVFGVGAGWAGALLLARVLLAQTGVGLTVTLGIEELRFVLAWGAASLVLALAPAALVYRVEVAQALRGSS